MPTKNPQVDAYIAKAKPFAQPVLRKLRTLVHKAVPQVEETIKWGMPHFSYKGMFCGMGAFKAHCIFGFWKHALLDAVPLKGDGDGAFGNFRSCITSITDLPSDAAMLRVLKAAKKLNDDDVKLPKRKTAPSQDRVLSVPMAFLKAIKANKKATQAFNAFSYSHRKEYVEWIADAKSGDTRARRIAQAIDWMADGKSRNWKYARR
jgi:hypothetical protein